MSVHVCIYHLQMQGNLRLADDILRAAANAQMPKRSVGVTKNEKK